MEWRGRVQSHTARQVLARREGMLFAQCVVYPPHLIPNRQLYASSVGLRVPRNQPSAPPLSADSEKRL